MKKITGLGVAGAKAILFEERGLQFKHPVAIPEGTEMPLMIEASAAIPVPGMYTIKVTGCVGDQKTGYWVSVKFIGPSSLRMFIEEIAWHMEEVAPPSLN